MILGQNNVCSWRNQGTWRCFRPGEGGRPTLSPVVRELSPGWGWGGRHALWRRAPPLRSQPSGAPQPGMHLGLPTGTIGPCLGRAAWLQREGCPVPEAARPLRSLLQPGFLGKKFLDHITQYSCQIMKLVPDFLSSWRRAMVQQTQHHKYSKNLVHLEVLQREE